MSDWPTIPDASGNALHGLATNMEQTDIALDTPGGTFARKSFVFDGISKHIAMGDVLGWSGYSSQSWSFWYKTTTTAVSTLLGKLGAGAGFELVSNNNGKFVVDVRKVFITDDIVLESTATHNSGAWVHVAVVTTGAAGAASDFKMYFNGAEDTTFATVRDGLTGSVSNSDAFLLGATSTGSTPYAGSMTEPAVYSDVLTPSEVAWIYNSSSPYDLLDGAAPDNLEGWWRADGVSWPAQELSTAAMTPLAQAEDDHDQVLVAGGGGGGGGVTRYFKMRARDDGAPAPGYVTWIAQDNPDFAGAGFSGGSPTPVGSMISGSAAVVATWEE
jgi:hypothetical protein